MKSMKCFLLLAFTVFDGEIITCGGVDKSNQLTGICQVWRNKTWQPFPSLNQGRSFFTLNSLNDTIVVSGGLTPETSSSMEIYNKTGEKWEQLSIELTFARYQHCAVDIRYMFSCAVFENNVYISGGTDTYDDSVDMYDVDKDVWTRLTTTLNDGSSYYRQIINLNGALYLFAKVTEVYKDGIWSLVNDSTISENDFFNMVVVPCENYLCG